MKSNPFLTENNIRRQVADYICAFCSALFFRQFLSFSVSFQADGTKVAVFHSVSLNIGEHTMPAKFLYLIISPKI